MFICIWVTVSIKINIVRDNQDKKEIDTCARCVVQGKIGKNV